MMKLKRDCLKLPFSLQLGQADALCHKARSANLTSNLHPGRDFLTCPILF